MKSSTLRQGSDGVAWFIAAGNWAAWKFLAVTTGVMAYAMYTDQTSLTGAFFWVGAVLTVGIAYLLIDLGLPAMWDWYIRQEDSDAFTKLVLLIILIRSAATLTTSWWASPELSAYTTSRPNTESFAAVLDERKDSHDKRLDLAEQQKTQLENSKAARIKAAKREGARLIANAVASGNDSQEKMWRENPAFYDNLNKTSPWYKQNKAFADRVHKAQAEAAALLQKEEAKTEQAIASFDQILRGDTTSAIMAAAFLTDQQEYITTKSRRSNIYRFLDIFAFIGGILCTTAIAKRKKQLQLQVDERSFMSVIKRAIEHWSTQTLNWFEKFLGVDINGDGTIGGEQKIDESIHTSASDPVIEQIIAKVVQSLKTGADTSLMQKPDPAPLSAEHKKPIGFITYDRKAARATSYPDYVLFKQTLTDFTVDKALKNIDYWLDQKSKGNTDPVVDYNLAAWQNLVNQYGSHASATPPLQANTSAQHDPPAASLLQHTATEDQGLIDELRQMSNDILKSYWKDQKKRYDAYNSDRYSQKTRQKNMKKFNFNMLAAAQVLQERGVDIVEFLGIKVEE